MGKVTSDYNLSILHPDIAKEWHPTRNGDLTPKGVTAGSRKKVWWLCSKGHEWEAAVGGRTGSPNRKGRGCPYCAGQKADKDNNLFITIPEVAKEWHPTKNGELTAKNVKAGSNKKVWWLCSKGHEWDATVQNRAILKSGCPECAGKKAGKDNNLFIKFPEVAKEWHPTRNGDLTAKGVTPGSSKKVWWLCSKGHEWETAVGGRTRGRGCPNCYKESRISAKGKHVVGQMSFNFALKR